MYLMLTWLKCSFGTQTTGGGGIFFAIFLSFMTAHDTNQPKWWIVHIVNPWFKATVYNEILVSMLNVRKLVVKFAIVKQLHKEWKAICRQRLLWIPASPEPVLGLAATRSDESTLGIFADSTTSNITTNSAFVGSFALDFGEKLLYSSSWGMVPFLWDLFIQILGKISHFLCHTFHWHCLRIIFLHFPCTLYERVVCRREDISWVSVWFTIVLLVRLISCLMTKKIASHNSLTFHHLISGLVSLHNF